MLSRVCISAASSWHLPLSRACLVTSQPPQLISVSACLYCRPHSSFHSLPIILPFTQYRQHVFETHWPTLQKCAISIWGSRCYLQHTCPTPVVISKKKKTCLISHLLQLILRGKQGISKEGVSGIRQVSFL